MQNSTLPLGEVKGYGFVHFATDEAADIAIEKLNGMNIQGKEVYVTRFKKNQNTRYSQSGPTFMFETYPQLGRGQTERSIFGFW